MTAPTRPGGQRWDPMAALANPAFMDSLSMEDRAWLFGWLLPRTKAIVVAGGLNALMAHRAEVTR